MMDYRCTALGILSLAALLPGCAVFRPTDPYAGLPPHASVSETATQPVQGPVTLEQAIEIAVANNPELAASRHDVEAATAQADVARGTVLPAVGVVAGYTRFLDEQRLVPARFSGEAGVFSDDIFSSDLVVTMPLFTGGRLISEIKAAELLQAASAHRLARSAEELVFNVSSVFYGILAQRRVVESLEFSKEALEEHLKRIQDLIAAQKAAKVDQLRTEVRIADLEQRLARERNVLAIQGRVLTNLLGLDRAEKPVEPAGELALSQAAVPGTDQALQQAFAGRSDYLAARAALEAQARQVDAARAERWPTVSLQGAYGGRWAAGAGGESSGADSEDVGRVGLVVDIPIFEGGRIKARVRREAARLRAAQERLRRLELQVQLDVETAILNVASASQRVQATEKAIEQAKESLRIEREKYDQGKGAIVDVLDAQSALLDSQTNYYRALADYNTALAQLRLAVGEGLR